MYLPEFRKQNMANIPDWKDADEALVREAVTDGDSKLKAQLQIATSADQRASVLSGIYIAAATGIIGAVVTRTGPTAIPLISGALIAAGAFMAGALLCIFTLLPKYFWTAGNSPAQWYKDISNKTPLKEALGEQAEHLADKLSENNAAIEANAKRFLLGALIGAFAPIIGLFGAGLTSLFWK
jgi:hypothetical protein